MTPPEHVLKEAVLSWIAGKAPDATSPYAIDGHPPMWIIAETADGAGVAVRPARTMVRVNLSYEETDGIAYQLIQGETWIGQGMKTTWADFARRATEAVGAEGRFLIEELEALRNSETDLEIAP